MRGDVLRLTVKPIQIRDIDRFVDDDISGDRLVHTHIPECLNRQPTNEEKFSHGGKDVEAVKLAVKPELQLKQQLVQCKHLVQQAKLVEVC